MKRSSVALLCGFLGTLATAVTIPSQVTGQAEIPTEKLVYALRLLNTEEYSYRHETGRFASRDELPQGYLQIDICPRQKARPALK